jgi:hypothetical protein
MAKTTDDNCESTIAPTRPESNQLKASTPPVSNKTPMARIVITVESAMRNTGR